MCHRRRWWLSHAAMSILPLKRRTDSAPAPRERLGFSGASALGSECGFRWASQSSMQSADISELPGGVPGPFQPDPHRRGTVPALCPLWGCWQDSHHMAAAWAIRRHWTALCLGGNRAVGNPQGYATVPLPDHRYLIIIGRHWDFLKNDPVGVCPSVRRCAVAWDFAA